MRRKTRHRHVKTATPVREKCIMKRRTHRNVEARVKKWYQSMFYIEVMKMSMKGVKCQSNGRRKMKWRRRKRRSWRRRIDNRRRRRKPAASTKAAWRNEMWKSAEIEMKSRPSKIETERREENRSLSKIDICYTTIFYSENLRPHIEEACEGLHLHVINPTRHQSGEARENVKKHREA